MPTSLGPKYALEWRGNPPHMLQPDIPVWYKFLEKYQPSFINLYYDCLLGGPLLTPDEERDRYERMWRALTAKRVDAIAELADEVWLIEVSEHPGMRAAGQLITYHALWLEDPKIHKLPVKVCVANSIDPDIATGLRSIDAEIHLVW